MYVTGDPRGKALQQEKEVRRQRDRERQRERRVAGRGSPGTKQRGSTNEDRRYTGGRPGTNRRESANEREGQHKPQCKGRPCSSRIRNITGNVTDITAVTGSTFNQRWARSKVAHFCNHLVELNFNKYICQHQLCDYTSFMSWNLYLIKLGIHQLAIPLFTS